MNYPSECAAMRHGALCANLKCELLGSCANPAMVFDYISPEMIDEQVIERTSEIGERVAEEFNFPSMAVDESLDHESADRKKDAVFPNQLVRFYFRFPGQFQYRGDIIELDTRWLWFDPKQVKLEEGNESDWDVWEDEYDEELVPAARVSQWYDRNISKRQKVKSGKLIQKRERRSVIATLLFAWDAHISRPGYRGSRYFNTFDDQGKVIR